MSRTKRGSKGWGFEYWARRAAGKFNGGSIGSEVKRDTNRWERRKAKQRLKKGDNE